MTLSVQTLEKRGAVLIAESETHFLFDLPEKASGGWRSFYLRLIDLPSKKRIKRAWWLAHNGESFARNADSGKLFDYEVETYFWVEETILEFMASQEHET